MKPSPLLLPLSWLYGAGVGLRNLFFDLELLRSVSLSVPVVSVGNISTGGTGKTPFVGMLAAKVRGRGKKVAVVSRGYGRKTSGYVVVSNGYQRCAEAFASGDEPALLANSLDGVVVVVDEIKIRGASNVIRDFNPAVVILDDGFQHRALRRTHDIVLMSADELLGPSQLLPAGYRREPFSSLKRADLIVLTRCRTLGEFEQASRVLEKRIRKPVAGMGVRAAGIVHLWSNQRVADDELKGKSVVAVSGIARPESFEETASSLGLNILRHLRYPDHHWYQMKDVERFRSVVRETDAGMIVTTEKDAVRLQGMGEKERELLSTIPTVVIRIEPAVIAGGEFLERIVQSL